MNQLRDRLLAALGPATALQVQTPRQRGDQINANAQQGLERLSQISLLVLIAAALATASSMGAALWQRRASLATRRLQGFRPAQIWRTLMIEAGIVIGIGCLTGGTTGIYAQGLMDRYLRLTTGFPAPFDPVSWQTVEVVILVLAVALPAVAGPAYLASRVPPRVAFQE
jgi:ABC-type antimicrobial peptide transport system permease subunit